MNCSTPFQVSLTGDASSLGKVAQVRNTAPKDAVQRVLDGKKTGKEKLCEELEHGRDTRKR